MTENEKSLNKMIGILKAELEFANERINERDVEIIQLKSRIANRDN